MLPVRIVACGILMVTLNVSCRQDQEKPQPITVDSTESFAIDSVVIPFNPDDEHWDIELPTTQCLSIYG